MLTLYYSPGASSAIPHITLEEIRAPYCSESNASYTFSFVAGLDAATHGLRQASCHFRGYPAQGRARTKKGYSECTIRLNLSTSRRPPRVRAALAGGAFRATAAARVWHRVRSTSAA